MKTINLTLAALIIITVTGNTFAAQWSSRHHALGATYDGKTWKVVQTRNKKKDTVLALHDKTDGSSIFIRMEYLEGVGEYPDSAIAESLAESLQQSDPKLKKKGTQNITISGKILYSTDYLFRNKKYGKQIVRHAFQKRKDYLLILLIAWPADLPLAKKASFPGKHQLFINSLKL